MSEASIINGVYKSRVAARTALMSAGFAVAHSPAGSPEKWVRGDSRKAVAIRGRDWVVVDYPLTWSPDAVMYAGRAIDSGDWLG